MQVASIRRRLRPHGRAVGLALAAALLVAPTITVGVLKLTHAGGSPEPSGTASHRSPMPTSFAQAASGRDYQASTIAPGVRTLLGLPVAAALPTPRRSLPAALTRLHHPQRLFACVQALADQSEPKVVPLAVDLARWQGDPAAVIALPSSTHPRQADVFVVGPG
jgi:hypothetical protein